MPKRRFVVVCLLSLSAGMGCRMGPIELPVASSWHEYRSATLGVALEIPDYFEVREVGDNVLFRLHGANAVLLRFVDAELGRERGLWVGQRPSGQIELGGRGGELYRYPHGDGPVYSLTDAYVVPYRGKELGLEFRTAHDEQVRARMLKSFRFLGSRG